MILSKNERIIVSFLRYMPAIFIIVVSTIITYNTVLEFNEDIEKRKVELKSNYITNSKEDIKSNIATIANFINRRNKTAINQMQKELKVPVLNAYNIANSIYEKYKDTKSKDEITQIIKTSLTSIRFMKNRGYFFIYEMDGINILNSEFPNLEGKNLWNYKDEKGVYLLREMKKILEQKDETFYSWYWKEVDNSNKVSEKYGFFKKFEPYNWFIGTGEYLDYFHSELNDSILNHLKKLKYTDGRYFFIIDNKGEFLLSKNSAINNKNLYTNQIFDDFRREYEEFKNSSKTGAFISYTTPFYDENINKLSYVKKIDDSGWIVGTGFDLDKVNLVINRKTKELEVIMKEELYKIIKSSLIITILLLIISYFVSKYVEKILFRYKRSVEDEKLKYKKLMKNASDAIFIVNLDAKVIEFNHKFQEMLGYSKQEIYNLYVHDFEAIHSKELIKTNIAKTAYESLSFESKYKRKDGSLFDVLISAVRVKIGKEEVLYSSFKDISERVLLENYIKDGNSILEMIAIGESTNKIYDQISLLIEKRNKGARGSILKLEDGKLIHGSSPSIPEDYNKAINGLEIGPNIGSCGTAVYTGKQVLVEDISRDEKWKQLKNIALPFGLRSCWSEPIKDAKGKVLGAFGMYYDYPCLPNEKQLEDLQFAARLTSIVMQRDELQKHLYNDQKIMAEQAKLASMGEMIGNIAHQWRQPLSAITTAISGLKLKSEYDILEKKDIEESTDSIINQANYLSKTIDNFRNFIKGDNLNLNISLKEVIEDTLILLKPSLSNNFINVDVSILDDELIEGNKNELIEALINILNNSKDVLKSNIKNEDDKLIFIELKNIDKSKIELKIYDSGGGIPEDIINKVLEPYFTTKHNSQGTGLGLFISDKIVREKHKALLDVSNIEFTYNDKNYKGACFRMVFDRFED